MSISIKKQVMQGTKDVRNYFKQKQSSSKPTPVANGTNDVSQAEAIVEKRNRKSCQA